MPGMMRQRYDEGPARPLRRKAEQADFTPALRNVLSHLRVSAMACRSAARTDLFKACAVLSTSADVARTAYVETLMRCLEQALQKRPVMYRPGEQEVTFDEAWLLRAVEAAQAEDWDSLDFLIRSRVRPMDRRNLGYLICAISDHFSLA